MLINKTSMRWAAGSVLALSLIAFTVNQQDTIREQANKIIHFESRVTALETMLSAETETSAQLRNENEELRSEIGRLQDSIATLNTFVHTLQKKLDRNEATIKGIRAEMAKKDREMKQLKAELAKYQDKKTKISLVKTKELEQKIEDVAQQQEQLKELEKDEATLESRNEDELIQNEIELKRTAAIESIIKNTSVQYKKVECRKSRTSSPLKKIDEDGSNWVYTSLQFDLANVDEKLLSEEYFVLKIVNKDTGEEMPYLESNPASNNSDKETKGFVFQWRDNPVEVVYINMQAKTGVNYDAKIYFLNDDKTYLLPSSVKPVLRDGKIVN